MFIIIAVGTAHRQTFYAGVGALAAFVLVVLIGLFVHRPLSKVPENTLKFVVGLMLTRFGIFWTGEGSVQNGPATIWRWSSFLQPLGYPQSVWRASCAR